MEIKSARQHARLGPNVELIVLSLLAAAVLLTFRLEFHRLQWVLWLESAVYACIPVMILGWLVPRIAKSPEILESRRWIGALQTGALVFAMLPLLTQFLIRPFGAGDSFEIIALAMCMNGCWFLTIFSRFGRLARGAFAVGGSLVLFVCFMTQNKAVFVFGFLYALTGLWWLLGTYWNQVETKAIDGESNTLPIRGMATLTTLAVVAGVGFLAASFGSSIKSSTVRGFMPTSGGESWHDSFARSGIGDGDMLTAGQNATTAGAVESDQFIEDTKPSMYDITTEKYSGPLKKKQSQHRAQALQAQSKHVEKVVQSEQAGRSFRTFREPKNPKTIDLESRITKALFFVEGSVPARFTVDCFNQFDGCDWTKADLTPDNSHFPPIEFRRKFGKPWFVINNVYRKYLTNYRSHRVKIMRLEDEVIPAPPLFKSWHIPQVDQRDLFDWDEQGLVRMDSQFIPTQSIINVVSQVPNYFILREKRSAPRDPRSSTRTRTSVDQKSTQLDSLFLQVPDNSTKSKLLDLTNEWTKDVPPGWSQVEAIVNRFRERFTLDPTAVPPADREDSVGWFLESNRGPAYLFATAATQALRTAGYKTRLASGFLATHKDYDRISNQSIVTSDNLHMWPEVTLNGWHWLAVEPTAGYPLPYNVATWSQRVTAFLFGCWQTVISHPLQSALIVFLAGMTILFRRSIVATLGWIAWKIGTILLPNQRLKFTRQLLDLRLWAANLPRPSFVTPGEWFSQFESNETTNNFVRLWQAKHFSTDSGAKSSKAEVHETCLSVVNRLSLQHFKSLAKKRKLGENKS